jgi:hypothetical protein
MRTGDVLGERGDGETMVMRRRGDEKNSEQRENPTEPEDDRQRNGLVLTVGREGRKCEKANVVRRYCRR